uniref:Uncharacterized protein n=1 Tax=Timema shepardi TaxID=629360 RepID=A0A7R9G4G4_TIMSH|nr:unnamed protein product [Timema shepardi]
MSPIITTEYVVLSSTAEDGEIEVRRRIHTVFDLIVAMDIVPAWASN